MDHAKNSVLHRGGDCRYFGTGLRGQMKPSLPSVTVFATGLNNPRGLKFGPDGYLYVAEGGAGGTESTTITQCAQVPAVGPYTGGMTARISRINRTRRSNHGCRRPALQPDHGRNRRIRQRSRRRRVHRSHAVHDSGRRRVLPRTCRHGKRAAPHPSERNITSGSRQSQRISNEPSGRPSGTGRLRARRDVVRAWSPSMMRSIRSNRITASSIESA